MEIEKISNKYTFYEEGSDYVLDLGTIKRAENRETEFLITGIEDSKSLTIKGSCGCVSTRIEILDKNTVKANINYTDCESKIAKLAVLKYKGVKVKEIKIKGSCN